MMRSRSLITALASLAFAAGLAAPARADDDDRRHGKRHWHHRHHHSHGHWHHMHRQWHHHGPAFGVEIRPAPVVVWEPPVAYPAYAAYPEPPIEAVPLRSFHAQDGRYCREYQRVATVGGVSQQVYGTACRIPDGSWQIVSE